jgi:hypothetical protein
MAMLSMTDNVKHMQQKVLVEKLGKMLVRSWISMDLKIIDEVNTENRLKNWLFLNKYLFHHSYNRSTRSVRF